MTVLTPSLPLDLALDELVENIHRAPSNVSEDYSVHRLAVRIDPLDPLAWLAAQEMPEKFYWRNRDGDLEIAALGAAESVAEPKLAGDATWFGGQRFDPTYPIGQRFTGWDSFGDRRFILPRFELRRDDDLYFLICSIRHDELSEEKCAAIADQAAALRSADDRFPEVTTPSARLDNPDHSAWLDRVGQTLSLIEADSIKKLVLARQVDLTFDRPPSPWSLLNHLRRVTTRCFLFAFQPDRNRTFFGASPERLYCRNQDNIETEAVAGTRPRGEDADSDRRFAADLAESRKERWEHRLVVSGLESGLGEICDDYRVGASSGPLKLARVQHLVTPMTGHLKPNVSDNEVLSALQPSAAVGGYPTDRAVDILHDLELFDRGWYAGPIGWVSEDSADFAVAIRSALLDRNRLSLFSGAGIVSDSDPEQEWDEIESKIASLMGLIGENEI